MNQLSSSLLIKVRFIFSIIGAGLIFVSLGADFLNLSASGLSIGQVLVLLIGIGILTIGLLGKKFASAYQQFALAILNTFIFIVIIEIGFGIVSKVMSMDYDEDQEALPYENMLNLDYYQKQDWGREYWVENTVIVNLYFEPFVQWKAKPFDGNQINVDAHGNRVVPNANCSEDAYTVFVFGGSTVFGTGSPDSMTIPAYLQNDLETRLEQPVCVMNMGQLAYVAQQSLIYLLLEIQAGNIPDMVIFYQGVNDSYSAYLYGSEKVILGLETIADRFEGVDSTTPLGKQIVQKIQESSYTYGVLSHFVSNKQDVPLNEEASRNTYQKRGIEKDLLASAVIDNNVKIYQQLEIFSQLYGFDFYYFWQPIIDVDTKIFSTDDEQQAYNYIEESLLEFDLAVYEEAQKVNLPNFYYIGDVFEGVDQFIWIDRAHIVPEGNKIVSEKIIEIIDSNMSR